MVGPDATLILAPAAPALLGRAATLAAARALDVQRTDDVLVVRGGRGDVDALVADLAATATPAEAAVARVLVLDGAVDLTTTPAAAVIGPALTADTLAAVMARTAHGSMLDALIGGEGVQAVYQPVIDIRTGQTLAFEALLRLDHDGRAVPPLDVFRAAIDSGRLAEADAAARRIAVRGASGWIGGRALFVNLEPAAVERPADLDDTVAAVARAGLRAGQVTFEATVPSDGDHRHLLRVLGHLRARGFGVALDDVTDADDALGLVEELRPDTVKIARPMITALPGIQARGAVAAVVGAAHAVAARVVAKGIETPAQLDAVLFVGVDDAQGWQVGQPMRAPGAGRPALL